MPESPETQPKTTTVSVFEYRKNVAGYVDQTQFQGRRFIVTRHGRGFMAQVTLEDLAFLEAFKKTR